MTSDRLVRLASLLKLMRQRSGLTQEQLAAESGVSESTIRRLESGRAPNPTLLSLEKLQEALAAGPEDRRELAELLARGRGVQAFPDGADGAGEGDGAGRADEPGEPDEPGEAQPGRLRSPAAPSGVLVRDEVLSAARDVALEIRRRWRLEEERRRVHDPFPLPVRWRRTDPALSDHEANVERLPPGAAPPDPADLGGDLPTVADFYRRRHSGRLVVLGRAGSGKSVLTIRFVQDFLETRTALDRVPVIFSIGSWDPTARTLRAWMTERLVRDHPHLAVRVAGTSLAGALIEADLVLPVLDGFDEMAEGLRGRALELLNEFSSPLLLTSRREEFAEAVDAAGTPLVWATVIELADLTVDDVAAYLPRTARRNGGQDGHGRGVWDAVTERLRERSEVGEGNGDGDSAEPLTGALRTPLMTALARTLYSERTGADPAELLDAETFPDESSIEEHLLAGFVPAVYRRRTPEPEPARDWDPDRAEQWLGYLAHHLAHPDRERQDLAWWEIGDFLPRRQRVLSVALTATLCAALSTWVIGLLIGRLPAWRTLVEGALMGPAAGLAFAAVYGVMIARGGGTFEPAHVRLRLRPRLPGGGPGPDPVRGAAARGPGVRAPARAPLRLFTARFGAVMAGGFVMGVGCACALAVERELAYGAVVLNLAVLEGVAVNMLVFGLIFGAGTGLVFGLLAAFEAPLDVASAADPISLLAANRATVRRQLVALVPLLALSVAFGGGLIVALLDGFLGDLNWEAWDGLYVGAVVGLGGGLSYALSFTAWGRWVVRARLWLPMTGKLPWDTAAFLDDAYRRGVLRQAGAVYQFRHVRLQHHLGRTYRRRQAQRSQRWASVGTGRGPTASPRSSPSSRRTGR
ncbi:helix-turn-helix domain-containing protein (plasmid) [Streptomyces sp. NBC_01343]|uniref:helix-turn-helix domain-containing protein n=1 Tax=Streptomyces sp. NBC_01343 TaxID=2903832 RepID=UPI002E123860|nr:helix-turn-helix domain-containing protein [Streptomyces sp. NBC_01343]